MTSLGSDNEQIRWLPWRSAGPASQDGLFEWFSYGASGRCFAYLAGCFVPDLQETLRIWQSAALPKLRGAHEET